MSKFTSKNTIVTRNFDKKIKGAYQFRPFSKKTNPKVEVTNELILRNVKFKDTSDVGLDYEEGFGCSLVAIGTKASMSQVLGKTKTDKKLIFSFWKGGFTINDERVESADVVYFTAKGIFATNPVYQE